MKQFANVLLLACITSSGVAIAQNLSTSLGLYVYPGEGQTIEQLAIDENECHQWAQQQAQAQAQAEAQSAERLESFKKAYSACMEGRKYTVN
jgi:hypothetical protein